jgi:hypothetical protein
MAPLRLAASPVLSIRPVSMREKRNDPSRRPTRLIECCNGTSKRMWDDQISGHRLIFSDLQPRRGFLRHGNGVPDQPCTARKPAQEPVLKHMVGPQRLRAAGKPNPYEARGAMGLLPGCDCAVGARMTQSALALPTNTGLDLGMAGRHVPIHHVAQSPDSAQDYRSLQQSQEISPIIKSMKSSRTRHLGRRWRRPAADSQWEVPCTCIDRDQTQLIPGAGGPQRARPAALSFVSCTADLPLRIHKATGCLDMSSCH